MIFPVEKQYFREIDEVQLYSHWARCMLFTGKYAGENSSCSVRCTTDQSFFQDQGHYRVSIRSPALPDCTTAGTMLDQRLDCRTNPQMGLKKMCQA